MSSAAILAGAKPRRRRPMEFSPSQLAGIAARQHIRRDVFRDTQAPTDHRMPSDADKLMYRGDSSDRDPLFDNAMTRKHRGICHDHMISHDAIMRDVT